MKKKLIFILGIVITMVACKTKAPVTMYSSYYKKAVQRYYFKGPVKKSRQYYNLYNRDSLLKNKRIYLYNAVNSRTIFGWGGYTEFDKYKTEVKRHSIRDYLSQTLLHDTMVVRSKKGPLIRVYKYAYFDENFDEKRTYKQHTPIKKHVFNPYRVYFNIRTYEPFEVIVQKDSSYKKQTRAYEYVLNTNNTVHQEIGKTLWDNDLDGRVDEETMTSIATYHYNDKNQLVKKTFEFGRFPEYPDHSLSFWGTGYIPQEEYTYDEAGNLTSVNTYLLIDGRKVGRAFGEEYTYDVANNLISKISRTEGGGSMNKDLKSINELFYNEKEEEVKVIAYEDDGKTIHATYKFEYSGHDTYDNWTQCFHYLNDEKKPYAETTRVFEYYKE